MNMIGRGEVSLRKIDVIEGSRDTLSVGYKKITFAHEASIGETGIDLSALVFPTSLSATLVSNPSYKTLMECNLRFFYKNMTLFSSARGILIPDVSFTASNSAIAFNSFTSYENEIFYGVIDYVSSPNTLFVDARPINVSRTLGAASTVFNVGEAYRVNQYPLESSGSVKVFANGSLKYRNTENSDTNLDRDYREVPSLDGFGTTIEFNSPFGSPTQVTVVSNHAYVDRPDFHLMQKLDILATQLESIATQGSFSLDLTSFPNTMDLKSFGDRLLNTESALGTFGAIGDVVSSRLNLAQFQTERDVTWVACDGSSYAGSDLDVVTGVSSVPNLVPDANGSYYIKINRN